MARLWIGLVLLTGAFAQSPVTMKQLMLDLIYPASNQIVLTINRGGPENEAEWAAVRHSALTLVEAGDLLSQPAKARDQTDWIKHARALGAAGAAAYKAAQAKDASALAGLADSLDASCTACHKQYRPNVFPREGATR